MSEINPLLKLVQDINNENEAETNTSNKNENLDAEEQPKTKKVSKKKSEDKSSQKKKKKLLLDSPPDYKKNEPKSQLSTKSPDFKYLQTNISLLDEFKANPEWETRLVSWFSRLRPQFNNLTTGEDISLKGIITSIQNGEMPKSNDACNIQDVDQVLFFFERKLNQFEKSDLAWIFSSLIFTDRLLNQEMSECLSRLLSKIIKQINDLESKEDPLYPYLMTDAVLLQRFFHI
ncbi:hypothetical protein M9Y10_019162 [Tritrichomonas musculus]|uniref:Gem-associated protein 2 n=1 Tax=Tritrichomonas musculus TaxID=1915356 RepID=A0ABR2GJI1_9EUKA